MKRRDFIGAMALGAGLAISGGAFAVGGPEDAIIAQGPYRTLQFIDVTVSVAGREPRVLRFTDGKPQIIEGAVKPLAIAVQEHDGTSIKLVYYSVDDHGRLIPMHHTFPGIGSTQDVGGYGVTLRIAAT